MRIHVRVLIAFLLLVAAARSAGAEILIRWDQDQVPPPEKLGVASLVIPADNTTAARTAVAGGYRVYLEVQAASLADFTPAVEGLAGILVNGSASPEPLVQLRQRLKLQVRALDERAKWPHLRSNAVRRNNDVLQVTGRSQQPWIENNGALVRIREGSRTGPPVFTYRWTPVTLSEVDEGPAVENYLVAIAEAGTFGADLVLWLHERLQRSLLLDQPQAWTEWNEIRRYVEFYSRSLSRMYQPIANVGVVTADPMRWFEVMNLLTRHNVPFELVAPNEIAARSLDGFDLLLLLDEPRAPQPDAVARFERSGGTVVRRTASEPIGDPNAFALKIRQLLGRERRAIDIWNGITVLTAPYREADARTVLVKAINYAHQPLPVQLRVRGIFSLVRYECPEQPSVLLAYEHRDGYTEFVIPSLRIGGRVLLGRQP